MFNGPEIKNLMKFLRNSQFLREGDEIVNFSFSLPVEAGFDLVKEHIVPMQHLKTVNETVGRRVVDNNRIFGRNNYLIRFDIRSDFKFVDLHLKISHQ
jgi:hypothetical protein